MSQILTIDDHPVFRTGLVRVLGEIKTVTKIFEASTFQAGRMMCESIRPDLVIVDVRLPDVSGLPPIEELKRISPRSRILVLSAISQKYAKTVIEMGADDFAYKGDPPSTLLEKIVRLIREHPDESSPRDSLSEMEIAVAQLVAAGLSNAAIADRLSISVNTVKTHLKNVFRKLRVSNRTMVANTLNQ